MRRLLLTLLILSPALASAQVDKTQAIEALLHRIEGEENQAELLEELERLFILPLDINSALPEELARLPLMDDFFIRNLLLERSRRGRFLSIYDLKEVQGAPPDLHLLEPFIVAEQAEEPRRRSVLNAYLGTESNLQDLNNTGGSFRVAGQDSSHLSWVFLGELDRGEPLLPLRKGVMDYLSGTLEYRKSAPGSSLQVILGDYKVTTGLGLMMGQATSYFSTMEAQASAPSMASRNLRPHASFREYDYLRGAAVELGLKDLQLSLFAGYEPLDARIEKSVIRTLYTTGRHITESEQRYRHTARRELAGGYLEYNHRGLHAGLAGMLYRHKSREGTLLIPPARYPQHQRLSSLAFDFYYLARYTKFFGETTLAPRERLAATLGAAYTHELWGEFTLAGSYAGQERLDPYGTSWGYSSSGRDEMGMRFAWTGEVAHGWTGRLYLEGFTPLSERSRNFVATTQVYYHGENRQLQGRFRYVKLANQPGRWTSRLALQQSLSPLWKLRSSLNLSKRADLPLGWALALRGQYGGAESLRAEVGLHYFDLPQGIGVRSDTPYMPYRWYAPALFGKGLRLVGVLRYPITQQLRLEGRISHTTYTKKPTTPLPSLLDLSLTYRM